MLNNIEPLKVMFTKKFSYHRVSAFFRGEKEQDTKSYTQIYDYVKMLGK